MKFEQGDLVQLSPAGIEWRTKLPFPPFAPKNHVGKVLSVEWESFGGLPAVYVVDFDGFGVFMNEDYLEAAILDELGRS
jgi:hypothetical protein